MGIYKTIKKMRENSHDWRIEQLESVAAHYCINVRKTGGSHVVFDHPKLGGIVVRASTSTYKTYICKTVCFFNRIIGGNQR